MVKENSVQLNSAAQFCLTLCNPMDCSTTGFSAYQQIPEFYSNSCPLSQWCHPTISSSVVPFSSCLQSFSSSGSFQMSHFFTSGGQSIGVSASASVLPMNIQEWFPLGWTGWISLQSKGHSRKLRIFNLRSCMSILKWIGASVIDNYLCGSFYCTDFFKINSVF